MKSGMKLYSKRLLILQHDLYMFRFIPGFKRVRRDTVTTVSLGIQIRWAIWTVHVFYYIIKKRRHNDYCVQ